MSKGRVWRVWFHPEKKCIFQVNDEVDFLPEEFKVIEHIAFVEVEKAYWASRGTVATQYVKIVTLEAQLSLAEGLLLEIFRSSRPRDFVGDWYDRAQVYFDKLKAENKNA